jgi:hypothetical protein
MNTTTLKTHKRNQRTRTETIILLAIWILASLTAFICAIGYVIVS